MKKYVQILVLCLAAVLLLCGCPAESAPTEATVTTEATESTETTAPTQPQWLGYSSPKEEYTYYYTAGRNLEWEEDVIFFADSHLSDNQLLRNRPFLVNLPGGKTDSAVFYNEELHQEFLAAVNALIPEIGNLSDDEILWKIQMIAALFSDVHTSVYLPYDSIYPILFMPFNEDGQWVFYAAALPTAHEKLLFTELTAINGHPISEVVDAMRCFVSHENEYGLINCLAGGGYGHEYLSAPMALEATGLSPVGSKKVTYTLLDQYGLEHDIELEPWDRLSDGDMTGISLNHVLSVPYTYDTNEHYWYTTTLAENTLYIRIRSFEYESEETYMNFSGALTVESNTAGRYDKVMVDLRGNGGGHQSEGWRAIVDTLCRIQCDEYYILVDGGTYSCSILFASEIKHRRPEVSIAGMPAGEGPGFFAGIYDKDYLLPNSGVEFTVPTQYCQAFDPNEENTVIPDLTVWLTLEDYITCRDVALEYVLAQ